MPPDTGISLNYIHENDNNKQKYQARTEELYFGPLLPAHEIESRLNQTSEKLVPDLN